MVISDKWLYFRIMRLAEMQNYNSVAENDHEGFNLLYFKSIQEKRNVKLFAISKNSMDIITKIRINNIDKKELIEKLVAESEYINYMINKEIFYSLNIEDGKAYFVRWILGQCKYGEFNTEWLGISDGDIDVNNPGLEEFFFQLVTYFNFSEERTEERVSKSRQISKSGKKIINNTGRPFFLIDTTWNTELIIAGTTVNGYWRNQRYGRGWSKRKLIYIDPFKRGPIIRKSGKERYKTLVGEE